MTNIDKLTAVPQGGNVVDGRERFLRKEIDNLVGLKEEEIYDAAAGLLCGETITKIELLNFEDVDEEGNVRNVDVTRETAAGVLEELRKRFAADNKDGRQEDDGTLIWTGRFNRGDSPFRISTIEKYVLVDNQLVPVSATARIFSPKTLVGNRSGVTSRHPSNYPNNAS